MQRKDGMSNAHARMLHCLHVEMGLVNVPSQKLSQLLTEHVKQPA
jgi:hypothetical protein